MPTNLNTTPSGTRAPRRGINGGAVEIYDYPEPPKTHYTNVPQEVVRRTPAEWYYPHSPSLQRKLLDKLEREPIPKDDRDYSAIAKRSAPLFREYADGLLGAKDVEYTPVLVPWRYAQSRRLATLFPGSWHMSKVIGGSEEAQRKANEEGDPSDGSSDQSGDPSEGGKPSAKPNYDNTAPVDILGFASSQRSNHYVGAGPKPSVPGWPYDSRTAAKHPSYASRPGDVASWDLVEGAPTINWATPIKDGNRWFAHETVLPDYSADWTPLERSEGTYANRMPATNVEAPVKSMQASGLLSPVTSVSYKGADGQATDTSRFMRLQDLFTDSLIYPPFAGSAAEVSKRLSDSIGDARRDAILESRNGSIADQIALSTLGRHQLGNLDNLALPITYTNDTLPGAVQRSVGTGSALRGLGDWDGPMERATPFHRLFMEDGIVRVKNPEDFDKGPSYSPATHTVNLPEGNSYSPVLDITAKLKDTEDPYAKFKKAVGLGRLMHWNDSPANAAAEMALDKNHRAALRHEGTHAMTSFATNPVESPTVTRAREALKSVRDTMQAKYGNQTVDGVDKWSDKPEYNRYESLQSLIDDLKYTPEHGETALGLALGVDSDTKNNPQGYAGNNLSEMLRSLHEAKMGYARYLIANAGGRSPEEIVETVQDPDKVLDFLQNIYNPMRTKDAPVSYSFPSDMSQVGSEVEMARSLGGIQPLVERLLQAKNNPDAPSSHYVERHTLSPTKDNTQKTNWKRRVITPAQQLEVFRKIWPQVRNNTADNKYNTLA